jgi:hypothetical protein
MHDDLQIVAIDEANEGRGGKPAQFADRRRVVGTVQHQVKDHDVRAAHEELIDGTLGVEGDDRIKAICGQGCCQLVSRGRIAFDNQYSFGFHISKPTFVDNYNRRRFLYGLWLVTK